jgi:hypothetical protein
MTEGEKFKKMVRAWPAAAAITTSFFGGQTLVKRDISAAAWIAIGCFVLLGFAVLLVLWPRRDWEFSLAPDQFIATYLEPAEGERSHST